jgi:hypothetical protein
MLKIDGIITIPNRVRKIARPLKDQLNENKI